jgi:hypothetical protein
MFVQGKVKKITNSGSKNPIRYEGSISEHQLDLADFSGVVTLEPMFVVKNGVPTGKLILNSFQNNSYTNFDTTRYNS